ncbi:hypothetical protein [Methylomonas fluvii]|uniref:Uncharacterized protein n=1 Tax=Methylomonas fluvii TaxID=1854564 RepID=A0ABR9DJD4_9GAMM|nr:hypothetical protein [Methylomonas fluvii]MBD9362976.1 hypothetical protein [Methylomonas fluvii]CAD6876162.1 hypothetical protein [Methylomonas fluvii]
MAMLLPFDFLRAKKKPAAGEGVLASGGPVSVLITVLGLNRACQHKG